MISTPTPYPLVARKQIDYVPASVTDENGKQILELFPKCATALTIRNEDWQSAAGQPVDTRHWTQLRCGLNYRDETTFVAWVRTNTLVHQLGITTTKALKSLRNDPHIWMRRHYFDSQIQAVKAFVRAQRKLVGTATHKYSRKRTEPLPYSVVISGSRKQSFLCLTKSEDGQQRELIPITKPRASQSTVTLEYGANRGRDTEEAVLHPDTEKQKYRVIAEQNPPVFRCC